MGNICRAQRPPVTPAWAFGHIVWEDSLNTSAAVNTLVEGYLQRGIPVNAVIIDSPWSESYNDFTWDAKRYPDHQNMIDGFRNRGVKVILWLTGTVNRTSVDTRLQQSPDYDHVIANRYAINNGAVLKWWKGEGVHLDFTSKDAVAWWNSRMDRVFTPGVYGWKVDQAEWYFGDTLQTSLGSMLSRDFRKYYYDAMYDYTTSRNPQAITIARPYSHQGGYYADPEKVNLGWSGDFAGDWDGLKLQIENIYRSAERGYGAPSCEVAGFFGARADREQFIRYIQFGAMTAAIVNGGENGAFTNHLPWFHGSDAERIYRFCVTLHDELRPYLFSTVVDAHLNGGSLIKNVSYEEESHQLGNDIFTKSITSSENKVAFHLPASGEWVDFWTGRAYACGTRIAEEYPLDRFPLFVRKGAIIPLHVKDSVTGIGDATMAGREVILIYPGDGKSTYLYHCPAGDGTEYGDVRISFDGATGALTVDGKKHREYTFIIRSGVQEEQQIQAAGKKFQLKVSRTAQERISTLQKASRTVWEQICTVQKASRTAREQICTVQKVSRTVREQICTVQKASRTVREQISRAGEGRVHNS
ncbi:MAG: hypothetical protein LBK22_02220 [Tannerella sp.]|jgi:alpha-glucosidase (family GH31 glycosyl hydrolase)|nr:hypothetical protein [Tannerella sp.]